MARWWAYRIGWSEEGAGLGLQTEEGREGIGLWAKMREEEFFFSVFSFISKPFKIGFEFSFEF